MKKLGPENVGGYRALDLGSHPPYAAPLYRSTTYRAPKERMIPIPPTSTELTAPVFGHSSVLPGDADLTTNAGTGRPALGERIIISGRVLGDDDRPVPNALVEAWQCNAAGRYAHAKDVHDAPLDENFLGAGRVVTDGEGRYRFTTIRPGAYPWGNHDNAWRPAHVHFSVLGPALITRLVTQMYFPGDPLLLLDPMFMSIPNEAARQRLVSRFDLETTEPHHALGYRFDIVLRGREETPSEAS